MSDDLGQAEARIARLRAGKNWLAFGSVVVLMALMSWAILSASNGSIASMIAANSGSIAVVLAWVSGQMAITKQITEATAVDDAG